ncbi:MAG: hypothetical protein JXP34_00965 [Planctomycetes bacterium]|nr:hypothetical protein [Planctomycetota bacterium]
MTRILAAGIVAGACAIAHGADPTSDNFGQRWEPAEISVVPGPRSATCLLDFTTDGVAPYSVQGWSLGFCIDKTIVRVDTAEVGADAAVCKAGGMPDFFAADLFPDGVGSGVVVDFLFEEQVMAPTSGFRALDVTFSNVSLARAVQTQAEACTRLDPFVIPAVIVRGTSMPFGQEVPLTIAAGRGDTFLEIELRVAPNEECEASVDLTTHVFSVDAVSFGIAHAGEAVVGSVDRGAATADAEFFGARIVPGGVTVGIVMSLGEPFAPLPPSDVPAEIARVRYPLGATLQLSDSLGTPPVDIVVDSGGTSLPRDAIQVDTSPVVIEPCDGLDTFVRGDANQDAAVNIADALCMARFLFGLVPDPGCADAMDANDDGVLDTTDPMFLLTFLFLGGAAVPSPVPADIRAIVHADCGVDPTDDSLGCPTYLPCQL